MKNVTHLAFQAGMIKAQFDMLANMFATFQKDCAELADMPKGDKKLALKHKKRKYSRKNKPINNTSDPVYQATANSIKKVIASKAKKDRSAKNILESVN